jgi:folate-binding protein YgfZ
MQAPSVELIDAVTNARKNGIFTQLAGKAGLANLGLLEMSGPDALSFLQSQTTNDVGALKTGDGHLSARVTRTGHLKHLFSVHRVEDRDGNPTFWMLLEQADVHNLEAAFDEFLFVDDVTLKDRSSELRWIAIQSQQAPSCCEDVFGSIQFEPWDTLPEYSIRTVTRRRGAALDEPVFAIRRSLTGESGYLIGLPKTTASEELILRIQNACAKAGINVIDGESRDYIIETLRIEAGVIRTLVDTATKKRLLPETGIEGLTVSYTKGCYLGQEVIARVRTYGSVPSALRALKLDGPAEILNTLPEQGSPVFTTEKTKIGHWVHGLYSPLTKGPVAIAYLTRESRTPGQKLLLLSATDEPIKATVQLLPLYSAPDQKSRAFFIYDRGVRKFAEGHVEQARRDLEEALRLDPSLEDAYEAMGVILARSGLFHEAIDFFRRLEEIAPTQPLVNTNLSLYYMKIGDKPTAEDEAAKAVQKQFRNHLKSKGKDITEIANLESKAKRQDAERKKQMFQKVLAFDEDDPIALFGLGAAHSTLEEWEESAGFLERALVADKTNSAIYLAHGKALEALLRIEQARLSYEKGMAVASKRGDLMPLREMEHRMLLLDPNKEP